MKQTKTFLETLSNRYKGVELMFLFSDDFSVIISRLSLIFNKFLVFKSQNTEVVNRGSKIAME